MEIKYKAKFIEGEGIPKVGEYYYITHGQGEGWDSVEDPSRRTENIPGHIDDKTYSNTRKVRRMLCSDEPIKLGDKYIAIDGIEYIANEKYFKLDSDLKVVGEISNDAYWVKNGIEFDEESFFPIHIHDQETEVPIYQDKTGNIVETPIYIIKGIDGNFK